MPVRTTTVSAYKRGGNGTPLLLAPKAILNVLQAWKAAAAVLKC